MIIYFCEHKPPTICHAGVNGTPSYLSKFNSKWSEISYNAPRQQHITDDIIIRLAKLLRHLKQNKFKTKAKACFANLSKIGYGNLPSSKVTFWFWISTIFFIELPLKHLVCGKPCGLCNVMYSWQKFVLGFIVSFEKDILFLNSIRIQIFPREIQPNCSTSDWTILP